MWKGIRSGLIYGGVSVDLGMTFHILHACNFTFYTWIVADFAMYWDKHNPKFVNKWEKSFLLIRCKLLLCLFIKKSLKGLLYRRMLSHMFNLTSTPSWRSPLWILMHIKFLSFSYAISYNINYFYEMTGLNQRHFCSLSRSLHTALSWSTFLLKPG